MKDMNDVLDDNAVEIARLRGIITRQRRELKRLNKYLGPYWAGFRQGLGMEAECRLRGVMNATFGHKAVREAEVAAATKRNSLGK